jgi:AraC-like DNA-binding protein
LGLKVLLVFGIFNIYNVAEVMKGSENREKIEENWPDLAHRAKYSVTAFASLCGVSVRQLERNFRGTVCQPPKQLFHALRMRTGRKLLNEGASVKGAAYYLGYKRPEHFSRDFRRFFNICPSDARHQT